MEFPVLDAYLEDNLLKVWCKHCKVWHYHGPVEGHKVAHCGLNSPYSRTGYVIRKVT